LHSFALKVQAMTNDPHALSLLEPHTYRLPLEVQCKRR
jgi:hypothetical protein